MFKKILITTLLAIILFTQSMLSFSAARANAQTRPWYAPDFKDYYLKVHDTSASPETEIFGERYTTAQVHWVINGLFSWFLNSLPGATPEFWVCIFSMEVENCLNGVLDEVRDNIPFTGNENSITEDVLAQFTSQPISGIAYLKNIGSKLHLIPEAKAQGFGFSAAGAVLELWRAARNITYALMVVAILIIAFMIMFRVKISPQAVITVQSALPKIVISLIFITFSYAIAGFLIDIMYVVIGLIAALLTNSVSDFTWSQMFAALTSRSVFSLIFSYFLTFVITLGPSLYASSPIASILGGPIWSMLQVIIIILLIIILLVIAIRIAWLLLKTYVMLILKIIAGPFLILLGTVTSGGGIGPWIKSMVADLAVYPTVGFMFVLAFIFLRGAWPEVPGWIPPSIADWINNLITGVFPLGIRDTVAGNTWDPPLTSFTGATGFINLGVSFVIITLIPNVAEIIKGAVSGKPFAMGTAIGLAIGPGRWTYGQAERQVLGEMGAKYGPTVLGGGGNWWQRYATRLAARKGYIATPSVPTGTVRKT